MQVMLCQVNPTVGDLKGNTQIMMNSILEASQNDADVVLFPEMMTTGYPPRDLLYNTSIWLAQPKIADKILKQVQSLSRHITVIYGGLHQVDLSCGRHARYNAAYIIDPNGIRVIWKQLLPCYDVFDETRYFKPAHPSECFSVPIQIQGHKKLYTENCDVLICEDIWNFRNQKLVPWMLPGDYAHDPINNLTGNGPIFVLNASPFWIGKIRQTQKLVEDIALHTRRAVCWCNQVGAHDDIVTGGYSMVTFPWNKPIDQSLQNKKLVACTRMAKAFSEDRIMVRLSDCDCAMSYQFPDKKLQHLEDAKCGTEMPVLNKRKVEEKDYDLWCIYQALLLHCRDYCRRTGFKEVVVGLSGGVDSALVATLAAHALGGPNLLCVLMPSKYSSEGSITDSEQLAKRLLCRTNTKSIDDIYKAARSTLLSASKQEFNFPVTDENLQPRIRMLLLMSVTNDKKALLLTTGNKSEISVGYCTLYGDMSGGLALISDLWKTQVYELCKFINRYFPGTIPEAILTKEPSAELRQDQKDTDSLPPYEVLDPLLMEIVEKEASLPEIQSRFGKEISGWGMKVLQMYRNNEFKRQQMPPGCKLQRRSFGGGRRMPIAAKFTLVS